MCNALEHLSTMSGSKPDVIKMKRDCFQRLIRYMTQVRGVEQTEVPGWLYAEYGDHWLRMRGAWERGQL